MITWKWTYVACDNIEAYMRNEQFIPGVHWAIVITSKWTYVACDSIEDYMKNEQFIPGVHLQLSSLQNDCL